jgi:hypothetical protein
MNSAGFDRFSGSHDELLRDPIHDRFASQGGAFFHLPPA